MISDKIFKYIDKKWSNHSFFDLLAISRERLRLGSQFGVDVRVTLKMRYDSNDERYSVEPSVD